MAMQVELRILVENHTEPWIGVSTLQSQKENA